ncbi:HesB/IscA family protein [Aneurinibacillus terranovensis]|uniref:HesB/IscA family protein n=1 Tax=Aneurinibacillus terranovensis TaxID=278991 RepID=UPI0003FF38E9|nr:hypothetical protein [Aneurinibacillus terranovensis]
MIRFTKEAIERAGEIIRLQSSDGDLGIRICARRKGCELQYKFGWEHARMPGDAVLSQENLKIYLDFESFHYLSDAIVDYFKHDNREGFVIQHQITPCSKCKVVLDTNCH